MEKGVFRISAESPTIPTEYISGFTHLLQVYTKTVPSIRRPLIPSKSCPAQFILLLVTPVVGRKC